MLKSQVKVHTRKPRLSRIHHHSFTQDGIFCLECPCLTPLAQSPRTRCSNQGHSATEDSCEEASHFQCNWEISHTILTMCAASHQSLEQQFVWTVVTS